MLTLDPKTAALVLIDLQVGIISRELAPYSGPATLAVGKGLAEKFRAAGAKVVQPVANQYGWRLGRIVDPFGHHWEIGNPLRPWPPDCPG